jgi:N-methylhydantoinase B
LAPNVASRSLKSKEINVPVPSGSVIHVLSGGGGGWGDPAHRDPAASAADDGQVMA